MVERREEWSPRCPPPPHATPKARASAPAELALHAQDVPVPPSTTRVTRRRSQSPLAGFLEVAAVLAYGYWGWAAHSGTTRWAWALGAMIVAWILWDVFRVPGDGTAKPAVPVPGWVRLIIEAAYWHW